MQLFRDMRNRGTVASPPTSESGRRTDQARLPIGVLVHLISVGLVAAATIGVFYGIGFFLLARPIEEMISGPGNPDPSLNRLRSGDLPRPYSEAPTADRNAAPVAADTQMPRLTQGAALQPSLSNDVQQRDGHNRRGRVTRCENRYGCLPTAKR